MVASAPLYCIDESNKILIALEVLKQLIKKARVQVSVIEIHIFESVEVKVNPRQWRRDIGEVVSSNRKGGMVNRKHCV